MGGPSSDPEVVRRVNVRAVEIRAELLSLLHNGPALAADLLPAIKAKGITLSEVEFQLSRLGEERKAVDQGGGVYRLP